MIVPRLWISTLTFSDSSHLSFQVDDIVVIVGPNNSGKSAALRAIRDKVKHSGTKNPVILSVDVGKAGEVTDVLQWLEQIAKRRDEPEARYELLGSVVHENQVNHYWRDNTEGLQPLSRFFLHLLTAEDRLQAADPAPNIALTKDSISHPLHFLYRDDTLELQLSDQFRRAFGVDLIVHRNAGAQIPLYVGGRPIPAPGQDRVSYDYVRQIEELPTLQSQGDGMRSFAGILLHALLGLESILLIDEPEAFLHPPQARLLGRMLVMDKPAGRQLFVATHSGDVLRGILDKSNANVRVIRLERDGPVNRVRELDNDRILQFWNDPLLRYSNVLDGIFHERVVLTESDSDCRFYGAVRDALVERSAERIHPPDIMFTHCGGKHRLPLVTGALRELGVPVYVVVDFDVLSKSEPLKSIVEAAGGDWSSLVADWKLVKNAIDAKKPELSTAEVINEVQKSLEGIDEPIFPSAVKKQIQSILRRSSPWSTVKSVGKAYVPNGDPTQACDRLIDRLSKLGIFVVEVGELEGFARSVGNHGPTWVNAVLQKNLKNDPELQAAREFVAKFAL